MNNNELMWSHYTNDQRGVAIGVRIDDSVYTVRQILYNGISYICDQDYNHQTATEILFHKLVVWGYEEEVRVFQTNQHFIDVQIEEIITGRRMSTQDYIMISELFEKINPNIRIIRAEEILG